MYNHKQIVAAFLACTTIFSERIANAAVGMNRNSVKPPLIRVTKITGRSTWKFTAQDGRDITRNNKSTYSWSLGKSGYYESESCDNDEGVITYVWDRDDWEKDLTVTYRHAESSTCGDRSQVSSRLGGMPSWGTTPLGIDGSITSDLGYATETRTLGGESTVELYTGGRSKSEKRNLIVVSMNVAEHPYDFSFGQAVDPSKIKLAGLGTLGSDGRVFKALPDGETMDITPSVASAYYCDFIDWPGVSRHEFISTCASYVPADRKRTTLGVGELVSVGFDTYPLLSTRDCPTFETTGGSLYEATLTAPSNAANVTVTEHIRGESFKMDFTIVEPDHVKATIRSLESMASGAGVGVYFDVVLYPTNVCFSRVKVIEEGRDASDVTGYFTDPRHRAFSHIGHEANAWHGTDVYNKISDDDFDHCYITSTALPGPWYPGSFTWEIPAWWKVGDLPPTNHLDWTPQIFSIASDGKATIQKLGHSVSRTTGGVYSTNNVAQ
jgi:hypothetical protein